MNIHPNAKGFFFFVLFTLCLFPIIDAPTALVLGFLATLFIGNPFHEFTAKSASLLLKISIVGLGFGINAMSAIEAGKTGFVLTVSTIAFVLLVGWLLGRLLSLNPKTSCLISSGTAICGGSAIAAVSPIIKANTQQISVALGAVFVLNAIALLVFPFIGGAFELSQYQFGLWSAISIHDTSSVVGAASKYGDKALEIATTIKLARALWIIPLSLATVWLYKGKESKIKIPYFILFFILAIVIANLTNPDQQIFHQISYLAKRTLIATLFLIGAGLSLSTIKSVGFKTFLQASLLWILISTLSLIIILNFY